jgi:hypothetical protein
MASTGYEVLRTVRQEEPQLFDSQWAAEVRTMIEEAVDCEITFADDVLSEGVIGLTRSDMCQYIHWSPCRARWHSTKRFDCVYLAYFHREERKHECSHSPCRG